MPEMQTRLMVTAVLVSGMPGQQGRHAGDVQGVGGLDTATETHIVDDRRIDAGPFDRFLHGRRRDIGRMTVAQGAAEGADGRPAGRYNHHFFHGRSFKAANEVTNCNFGR
jgi:hypothetical protein